MHCHLNDQSGSQAPWCDLIKYIFKESINQPKKQKESTVQGKRVPNVTHLRKLDHSVSCSWVSKSSSLRLDGIHQCKTFTSSWVPIGWSSSGENSCLHSFFHFETKIGI